MNVLGESAEFLAEFGQCLRMELRHPSFGDIHDQAYLPHVQFVRVVQRKRHLFAGSQFINKLGKFVNKFLLQGMEKRITFLTVLGSEQALLNGFQAHAHPI